MCYEVCSFQGLIVFIFYKLSCRLEFPQQFYFQTFTKNRNFISFSFQSLYEECRFQSFILHLYFSFQSFDEDQKFQFYFQSFDEDWGFQNFFLCFYFSFTIEVRRISIPSVQYGHPKRSTQIIFLQHFWKVVLVLLVLFSKQK